jgi:hypothetical protein
LEQTCVHLLEVSVVKSVGVGISSQTAISGEGQIEN